MTKIVARRNKDGQIEILPQPVYTVWERSGDICKLAGKEKYKEYRAFRIATFGWIDVTEEVIFAKLASMIACEFTEEEVHEIAARLGAVWDEERGEWVDAPPAPQEPTP